MINQLKQKEVINDSASRTNYYTKFSRCNAAIKAIASKKMLSHEENVELSKKIIGVKNELEKILGRHHIEVKKDTYFRDALDAGYNILRELKSKEQKKVSVQLDIVNNEFYCARNKLTEGNMKLVIKPSFNQAAIFHYQDIDELLSEGILGLMIGAEKYDYRIGTKFSTYAYWWIKQTIGRHIIDTGTTVRVPVHMKGEMYKIHRTKNELTGEYHREPTIDEIAKRLGTSANDVNYIMGLEVRMFSVHTPINTQDEGSLTYEDRMTDKDKDSEAVYDNLDEKNMATKIRGVLDKLPERHRELLMIRFGFETGKEETLEDTAEILYQKRSKNDPSEKKVTRERIRQIELNALRKLRQPYMNKEIRKLYLESSKKINSIISKFYY